MNILNKLCELINGKKTERRKRYIWKPLPDITVYELAQLVPYFRCSMDTMDKLYYKVLKDELKRHIEVKEE